MRLLFSRIINYAGLCKVRISLFSAFSAATALLGSCSSPDRKLVALVAGVFLLSCGSCALNQVQERKVDALMPRTKIRPLPSGRVSTASALIFSVFLIVQGFAVLFLVSNALVQILGIFAIIWYNGIYTYLKRRTAFALIPGALVGVVPPVMGWVAGGSSITDPRLLFLCFFFFIWQVPHFWLLMLNCGDEYDRAGLPSLTGILTRKQLLRIVFVWISATAISCLFIPMTGIVQTLAANCLLGGASLWLVANGLALLRKEAAERISSLLFRRINVFMLLVMVFMSSDRLLK